MIFLLMMNDMRNPPDIFDAVGRAEDKSTIAAFLDRERVPNYEEPRDYTSDEIAQHLATDEPMAPPIWTKFYKKGGPLEWYKAADVEITIQEVPSREEAIVRAVDQAKAFWDENIGVIAMLVPLHVRQSEPLN